MCAGVARGRPGIDPAGFADQDCERLRISGLKMHLQQAGHDLVDRIEGRPDDAIGVEAFEFLDRERAQIAAVAEGLLAAREAGD